MQLKSYVFTQNSPQTGFLLSRQAHDTRSGIVLTFWLKTHSAPVKLSIENEQALFFVETRQIEEALKRLSNQNLHFASYKSLPLKTFGQAPVSAIYFNFMKDFYAARDLLKQSEIKIYEDDFRPEDRYLMERFITAKVAFVGQESQPALHTSSANKIQSNKHLSIHNTKCKPGSGNFQLRMVSIDIECAIDGALYSIAAFSETEQVVFMIGEAQSDSPTYIHWLENEHALLVEFIAWFMAYDADVLIGWNVVNFDLDLLQKRCDILNLSFAIGRDGRSPYWRKNRNTGNQYISIAGRVVLDGIDLLKTATYSFSSFSLENVSRELLGIGKKVSNVENRLAEITHNFMHNKLALAAYNLEDCHWYGLFLKKHTYLNLRC